MAITTPELSVIPAPVLVVSDADDDTSSGSFSEEGDFPQKSVHFSVDKNQGKDSGIDCGPEIPFIPPDEETSRKIREAVEYYLSDANVLKDTFLLKHLRRNKEGYVNLKLISSFRKVKSLSRNWKAVAYSLRDSKALALNAEGTKIRRIIPLPKHDETASSRTVVVCNLPDGKNVTVVNINECFAKCGDIALIRILKPGGTQHSEIKKFFANYPELQSKECALLEFEQYMGTKEALAMDSGKDTELRVFPLGTTSDEKSEQSQNALKSPSRGSPKKKSKSKRSHYGSNSNLTKYGGSESDLASKSEQIRRGSFGYNSSSSSGYLSSSPGDNRFPRRHSYNPSGTYMESSTPSFASLNNRSPYRGSKDRINKTADSDKSRDSSGNQSPWRRRRELLLKSESASTSSLSSIMSSKISPVKTIRSPFGPDGTSGFKPRDRVRLPSTAE